VNRQPQYVNTTIHELGGIIMNKILHQDEMQLKLIIDNSTLFFAWARMGFETRTLRIYSWHYGFHNLLLKT
jgi:hypothetical protein